MHQMSRWQCRKHFREVARAKANTISIPSESQQQVKSLVAHAGTAQVGNVECVSPVMDIEIKGLPLVDIEHWPDEDPVDLLLSSRAAVGGVGSTIQDAIEPGGFTEYYDISSSADGEATPPEIPGEELHLLATEGPDARVSSMLQSNGQVAAGLDVDLSHTTNALEPSVDALHYGDMVRTTCSVECWEDFNRCRAWKAFFVKGVIGQVVVLTRNFQFRDRHPCSPCVPNAMETVLIDFFHSESLDRPQHPMYMVRVGSLELVYHSSLQAP